MVPTKESPMLLIDEGLRAVGGVAHAFTTRVSGVSAGPYESLNLSLHGGDDPENVLENQRRVMRALGLEDRTVVRAQQPHGSGVAVLGRRWAPAGSDVVQVLEGVDALVTCRDDVALLLTFADCVPVFFAADDGSCVGVAHAGWRGVAADVVGATVAALGNAFGSQPERLSACIGPAIEWRCYEVGEDVLARVRDATAEFGEPTERGRWRVDLRKAVRCQLERAGLTAERISVDDHCTACDEALFFSHRRQGRPHGTMAAVIGIRRG